MVTTIKNNFETFKQDFKKDTGLDVKDNMGLYIQYYNARVNDTTAQLLIHLIDSPNSKLFSLSYDIQMGLAAMLKDVVVKTKAV